MKTRASLVLIAVPLFAAASGEPPRLRGDPLAVERIEKMLAQLGGAQAWADARTLYLEYRGWRLDPDGALTERAWRDLRQPNQRMELEGPKLAVTWAFTPQSGWASRATGVTTIRPERLATAIADWPFDFYTIIRSFAVADQGFTLEFVEPRRVVVKSAAGADWGWWEIDGDGMLVKWGSKSIDGEIVEYVYGPIRDFGGLRFPAWGAAVDGSWRFDYVQLSLSPDPIPAALLQAPQ